MPTRSLVIIFEDAVIENATKAAFLKGMKDISEYVVSLVTADSQETIDRPVPIVLDREDFINFIETCESNEGYNQKLIEARDNARNLGVL